MRQTIDFLLWHTVNLKCLKKTLKHFQHSKPLSVFVGSYPRQTGAGSSGKTCVFFRGNCCHFHTTTSQPVIYMHLTGSDRHSSSSPPGQSGHHERGSVFPDRQIALIAFWQGGWKTMGAYRWGCSGYCQTHSGGSRLKHWQDWFSPHHLSYACLLLLH